MKNDFQITEISRVVLVGENEYPERISRFDLDRDYQELIFHFSGHSTIKFNGQTFSIEPNTFRYNPAGKITEYEVDRKEHGRCIDIVFQSNRPLATESFILRKKGDPTLGALFKKAFAVWVAKEDGYFQETLSLIYKILAELQKTHYISESVEAKIKPAVQYIAEHFTEETIQTAFLADLCGIHYSYLNRIFMEKFGQSPNKYIIGLRIKYACDLLESKEYTVTEVAELCGYRDLNYFSRQFKEYVGVSPKNYMTKYRSSR